MNLSAKTQNICRIYGIAPARSKGQNFLVDESAYDSIIKAAALDKSDTVLEVGPGLGFLTAKLAKSAKEVIAVELDDRLAEILEAGLRTHKVENVKVINKNILDLKIEEILPGRKQPAERRPLIADFKIVANLPYNITSVFIRKYLAEQSARPLSMVLMLQKEVAERIAAKPPKMSLLAISVQFYCEPEIIGLVPARSFWPKPDVDSAIIKLSGKEQIPDVDEKLFFRLLKHGFSAKRKMLKNNLSSGLRMDQEIAEKKIGELGLNPKIRAEGLSLENWLDLFGEFREFMV